MTNKKKYRNLHIFNDPKFSKNFFEFLIKHGEKLTNDYLFHYRQTKSTGNSFGMTARFSKSFFSPIANLCMLKPLFQSDKIIIHSLASPFLLIYLFLFPSLAKKSYWVIWGKDLYFYHTLAKKKIYHKVYEFFRKIVIKRIPNIVTLTEGDFRLAQKWYQSKAVWHECYMYPSNLYKDIPSPKRQDDTTIILAGNSADPSNNHLEIFSILETYKDADIELIVPLSYGDKTYALEVISAGKQIFGEKFKAICTLLPLQEYLDLLGKIDIAIFAHNRQQAMGNIITLLGMGKKVFMKDDITSWDTLQSFGMTPYSIATFDLQKIDATTKINNQTLIKSTFSEENLIAQWHEILSR
jgi:hypothetical protein